HKTRKSASKRGPPRPPNGFMLYRSDKTKEIKKQLEEGGTTKILQSSLSKIIGDLWRSEPEEVREYFNKAALEQKEWHALVYPDYVFKPK
ncbi:high mobility group box domain-containing protein, partial [Vararia minispora EC-137]